MKKVKAFLLTAAILAASMTAGNVSAAETVEINGETVICASDENLEPAAEKLAFYIGGVCGQTPETSQGSADGNAIILTTDNAAVENGFVIEEKNGSVTITGSSLSQTVRGVYAFLERYAGIHCYTSKLIRYENEKILVPQGEKYEYTPAFEYTDTDWLSPKDTEYSLFNGLNSGQYRNIPEELGGSVEYISSFGHTLSNQFCSKDKYYKSHPEYFALYRGIRTDSQLCLSNPEVLEIVKREVLDLLRERHNPASPLQIVSLTQADNIFFCTCRECRKTDRRYGSHAGTMLEFVNAIAREVKAAGYDKVALDTFAYRYTRTPPHGIVPEDNVIVRLCSIECCFSHTLDDETCKTNVAFLKDLRGWSEICDRLYVWDYCTDYCAFVGIFPDFGTLQRNMQIFAENNVKGVYEEGNYQMTCDTEFGELRAYLISRLLIDPYMDFEKERNAFLNAYYGAGGKYIGEFLDIITESAGEKHLGIYEFQSNTLSLDKKQIAECDALWQKAKDETQGDEHEAVIKSELSWRYWKMENNASEFSDLFDRSAEKQKLTDEISARTSAFGEVSGAGAFFISLFQLLYFRAYPLVLAVLNLLYAV